MAQLIVGDVHGCYYTLKDLLQNHWRPEKEDLILVGDLINKGPFSAQTVDYILQLKAEYPGKVFVLRGNHEQSFFKYLNGKGSTDYRTLKESFKNLGYNARDLRSFFGQLPLSWENDRLLVTHAGICDCDGDAFDVNNRQGVLYNRKSLRRLRKTQVVGHNIISRGKPLFKPQENAWFIDTGAWCFDRLSALRFKKGKDQPKIIQVQRHPSDFVNGEDAY